MVYCLGLSLFSCRNTSNQFDLPKLDAIEEGGNRIVGFVVPVIITDGVPQLLMEDCGIRSVDDVCERFDGPKLLYGLGDGVYVL